jgi:hypothetical protein
LFKEPVDFKFVSQIHLVAGSGEDISHGHPMSQQGTQNGSACQTFMSGDKPAAFFPIYGILQC